MKWRQQTNVCAVDGYMTEGLSGYCWRCWYCSCCCWSYCWFFFFCFVFFFCPLHPLTPPPPPPPPFLLQALLFLLLLLALIFESVFVLPAFLSLSVTVCTSVNVFLLLAFLIFICLLVSFDVLKSSVMNR